MVQTVIFKKFWEFCSFEEHLSVKPDSLTSISQVKHLKPELQVPLQAESIS